MLYLQHGSIGDGTECPDGRGPIQVFLARHVLGQRRRDDDDVFGDGRQALDAQVNHAAQHRVLRVNEDIINLITSTDLDIILKCMYCILYSEISSGPQMQSNIQDNLLRISLRRQLEVSYKIEIGKIEIFPLITPR